MNNGELVKMVRQLAEKLGRTPKRREFKHNAAAQLRFGSWNNFIKAAGLVPLKEFDLTLEDYKKSIHDFVEKNGHTPTAKDFYNDMYLPDPRTMERKFKKPWSEILISLGYEPNIVINDFSVMSDKEILFLVKSELTRIGSTKKADYNREKSSNAPSISFLIDRFGVNWNDILKMLGLDLNLANRSKEEWLQLLKNAAGTLGKSPSISELPKFGLCESTYKFHFGSYNNALEQAGLDINQEISVVTHTDDELLQMYKNLCERLGHAATSTEIEHYLPYKVDIFAIRFGGLQNLRKLVGFPEGNRKHKYSKQEIENILLEQYKIKGRRLTNSEVSKLSKSNEDFPSITTICRYFQTTKMSEVWAEIEKSISEVEK